MPSILTDAAVHVKLNQLRTAITHLSGHNGDPGTTGANELAGGAYVRVAVAGGAAAASRSVTIAANVTFNIPAGQSITHVGMWSASSAGTYYGHADVTDEAYGAAGTYTLSTLTISET